MEYILLVVFIIFVVGFAVAAVCENRGYSPFHKKKCYSCGHSMAYVRAITKCPICGSKDLGIIER